MQSIRRFFSTVSLKIRNTPASRKARKIVKVAFSEKYLLYTNVTISVTLSSVGDILEQNYEIWSGEIEKWDRKRTVHMGFSGLAVGVVCHHWYKVLDRILHGRSIVTVLKKLVLDQTICSPIMIMMFFASVSLFEKEPIEDFTQELRDKFWKLYVAEWVVWPPAQIFNFYFLPTRYRVLYDNTISLGYDVYTSQVKHSKGHSNNETKSQKVEERILEIKVDDKCSVNSK